MAWDADGNPTWRGCPFVPFDELEPRAKRQAREMFSPFGRRGVWIYPSSWAFAVRQDGSLARCPYIEPISNPQRPAARYGRTI